MSWVEVHCGVNGKEWEGGEGLFFLLWGVNSPKPGPNVPVNEEALGPISTISPSTALSRAHIYRPHHASTRPQPYRLQKGMGPYLSYLVLIHETVIWWPKQFLFDVLVFSSLLVRQMEILTGLGTYWSQFTLLFNFWSPNTSQKPRRNYGFLLLMNLTIK